MGSQNYKDPLDLDVIDLNLHDRANHSTSLKDTSTQSVLNATSTKTNFGTLKVLPLQLTYDTGLTNWNIRYPSDFRASPTAKLVAFSGQYLYNSNNYIPIIGNLTTGKVSVVWPLPATYKNAQVRNVSGEGLTVMGIGYYDDGSGNKSKSWKWTEADGISVIEPLPGANISTFNGISDDGSVIVGSSQFPDIGAGVYSHVTRWTQAGGLEDLGNIPGAINNGSYADIVSGDGTALAGHSTWTGFRDRGFYWSTTSGGLVDIGFLEDGNSFAPQFITHDGSMIFGGASWHVSTVYEVHACYWTPATGLVDMGMLHAGVGDYVSIIDVSPDGKYVVGNGVIDNINWYEEAWIWTKETGMVGIGVLPGGTESKASYVSDDGNVIFGTAKDNTGTWVQFKWVRGQGMTVVPEMKIAGAVTYSPDIAGMSQNGGSICGHMQKSDGSEWYIFSQGI